MRFSVTYPLVAHPYDPALVSGDAIVRFCRAAEEAGFDGVGFTDHPAPTQRWLDAGGHDALDPFVALTYAAAVSEGLRLIPNILVLPYRNPFLVAKAAASLDRLSGGRFTLAVATGYLKGEYRALGVDFDERNDLFDEAIEVIRDVWTRDEVTVEGRHFRAVGQTVDPKPATPPPIWIGGNSRRSRRRVARFGDGWKPFPAPARLAATARTPPLETVDDLAVLLEDLWVEVDAVGRERSEIDVAFSAGGGGRPGSDDFDPDAILASVGRLSALGVTWVELGVPGSSIDDAIDALHIYGDTVIGRR